MAGNSVFLLETLLFEGGALAFGVWQLWSVWPQKKPKTEKSAAVDGSSPKDPGHPEG